MSCFLQLETNIHPHSNQFNFFGAYNQLYLTRYYLVKLLIKHINYIQIDEKISKLECNDYCSFHYKMITNNSLVLERITNEHIFVQTNNFQSLLVSMNNNTSVKPLHQTLQTLTYSLNITSSKPLEWTLQVETDSLNLPTLHAINSLTHTQACQWMPSHALQLNS